LSKTDRRTKAKQINMKLFFTVSKLHLLSIPTIHLVMVFLFFTFLATPSVLGAIPKDFHKKTAVAPIIGDPNNGTTVLNVAYSQATGRVQINFDAAVNGNFTQAISLNKTNNK
jgi:hypothetical protein